MDESKPRKERRPRTKYVAQPPYPTPSAPPTSSTTPLQSQEQEQGYWNSDPLGLMSSDYEEQPRSPQQPSAAMGSEQQGFDVPPIDQQVRHWNQPVDEGEQEYDPAQDPMIQAIKQGYIEPEHGNLFPVFRDSFRRGIEDVQEFYRGRREKDKKRYLELEVKGYYQTEKGGNYHPIPEIRQKVEVSPRKMLFPKRKRTFDQILKNAKQLREISGRRRRRRLRFTDPFWDTSHRLSTRSRHILRNVRKDPEIRRMADARARKKAEWRGLEHRKVYSKSKYKMRDINRATADNILHLRRSHVREGRGSAPRFKHSYRPTVPLPRHLDSIEEMEEEEEEDEGNSEYFPQQFVGFPSRRDGEPSPPTHHQERVDPHQMEGSGTDSIAEASEWDTLFSMIEPFQSLQRQKQMDVRGRRLSESHPVVSYADETDEDSEMED